MANVVSNVAEGSPEHGGRADPKFRERLLWALALSIAVHEIAAGLWPGQPPPPPAPQVISERVVLTRRTPPPTPRPTPVPTPKPTERATPAPHYTLAPRITLRAPAAKAAATPMHRRGGAAALKHVVRVTPPPATPRPAPPVSLANGAQAGKQNGGSGTGAGAGNGTGGLGGSGSGSGTQGNGTGSDANTAPCGAVDILPEHISKGPDGTSVQRVSASITLRDGDVQNGVFPYPFIYPSEADNPFLHDDKLTGGGVPVQQPPPGSDVSKMPPAVQVVLSHTDPATGRTLLPDCPKKK